MTQRKGKTLKGALAVGAAVAVASLIAFGGAFTNPAAQAGISPAVQTPGPPAQTYEGMITDTRCGAKHSAAIAKTASDCTRACVHSGEQFALIDGDQMYVLRGEAEALKLLAGQRARVMGTLNGKTIVVSSVRPPS